MRLSNIAMAAEIFKAMEFLKIPAANFMQLKEKAGSLKKLHDQMGNELSGNNNFAHKVETSLEAFEEFGTWFALVDGTLYGVAMLASGDMDRGEDGNVCFFLVELMQSDLLIEINKRFHSANFTMDDFYVAS